MKSNFALSGWALSVQPEIRDETKRIMNEEHHNKTEMVVQQLYTY